MNCLKWGFFRPGGGGKQGPGPGPGGGIPPVRRRPSRLRGGTGGSRRARGGPVTRSRRLPGPGAGFRQRRDQAQHRAVVVERRDRLLPRRHGVCREGAVSPAVPRQAQPVDIGRGAADRHRRPHAGLSARGDQARARAIGDRADPGAQPPFRRSDAIAGRYPDDETRSSISPLGSLRGSRGVPRLRRMEDRHAPAVSDMCGHRHGAGQEWGVVCIDRGRITRRDARSRHHAPVSVARMGVSRGDGSSTMGGRVR